MNKHFAVEDAAVYGRAGYFSPERLATLKMIFDAVCAEAAIPSDAKGERHALATKLLAVGETKAVCSLVVRLKHNENTKLGSRLRNHLWPGWLSNHVPMLHLKAAKALPHPTCGSDCWFSCSPRPAIQGPAAADGALFHSYPRNEPALLPGPLDHRHFRLNQPKVTNVIVDSTLARDRTVNRCPFNLITR